MEEQEIQAHVKGLLEAIDPEPDRQGLTLTPARVARALKFLTRGYEQDPETLINGALFDEDHTEMIVVKDIDFYSLCEHHILPFFGRAHVAYIPQGKIVGLSKIARLVDLFARRLQVQERMTTQIADIIDSHLAPLGVAVPPRRKPGRERPRERLRSTHVHRPVDRAEQIHALRGEPRRRHRGRMSVMNSSRVLEFVWNAPRMALVTTVEFCFSMPRMRMQRCSASVTTATPRGSKCRSIVSAISVVIRSCTCSRRA